MAYPPTYDPGQVQPWIIGNEAIAATAASGVLTANQVMLWAFEITSQVTITALRFRTGPTITGVCDVGIYDANGNLLVNTGAAAPAASSVVSRALATPLIIGPGRYYLAFCASLATDTYFRAVNLGANFTRNYVAVTAGSAGVLPATTGGIASSVQGLAMEAALQGGSA